MVEIDVNESVDQIFTDFDEKKRSRKTTSSSQALSLVFANESDEDNYEPDSRSRKEPKTPRTPYKGKYEKDLENLTPEQNQALSVAYESCTSKTAFGHPSDPTFTMEVAERTELDEKLVKAWFRRQKSQTPTRPKSGKYHDVFASLSPEQVQILNAEYQKCPFVLDNTDLVLTTGLSEGKGSSQYS